MKPILWMAAWLVLTCGVGLFAAEGNLTPRPAASDYPARTSANGVTVAAEAVPADQAKKIFGADLDGAGYVVLEVAFYPESGHSVTIAPGEFFLRGTDANTMRPAEAEVVAASVYPYRSSKPQLPGNVDVHGGVGIGYGTGGGGYGTNRGGVYTVESVGVGVGGGPSPQSVPPPANERQRNLLEVALTQKALPAGTSGRAVAGYLYFPKPARKGKKAGYVLTWASDEAAVRLTVPQ